MVVCVLWMVVEEHLTCASTCNLQNGFTSIVLKGHFAGIAHLFCPSKRAFLAGFIWNLQGINLSAPALACATTHQVDLILV